MQLPFDIPGTKLVDTYNRVYTLLQPSYEDVIFDAMASATAHSSRPFRPPASSLQFMAKHQEVQTYFSSSFGQDRTEVALSLMERVGQAVINGRTPQLLDSAFFDTVKFSTTADDVEIAIMPDLRWAIEWKISTGSSSSPAVVIYFDRQCGIVVPNYVVQYIHAAVQAFKDKMHNATLAMLTICVEATLRDYLQPHGYSYNISSPKFNQYAQIDGFVTTDGASYKL